MKDNMKVIGTKKFKINEIMIGKYIIRPIENKDEDLENLSESIEETGQINSILVRMVNGQPELISGGRRYAAIRLKGDTAKIEAKIVDADDFEAMIYSITENEQRKDIDTNKRDEFIYRTWIKGKESGKFEYIKDFAKKLGMKPTKLGDIISAGEEKFRFDDKSDIIKNASTSDLTKSKILKKYPEFREKVLELRQNTDITNSELENLSKKIKNSIDDGIEKDVIMKIIEPEPQQLLNILTKENSSAVPTVSSVSTSQIAVDKISDILDTIKVSPPDIKEKLINQKISLEEAKIANQYEDKEVRNKVVEKIQTYDRLERRGRQIHVKHVENKAKEEDEKKKQNLPEIVHTNFDKIMEENEPLEKLQRIEKQLSNYVIEFSLYGKEIKEMKNKILKKNCMDELKQIIEDAKLIAKNVELIYMNSGEEPIQIVSEN